MQIFDIRFNPKIEEDRFLNVFAYEPENIYEKRLGSLYITGDLTNALPQNSRLLDNTAQVVRKKYYNFSYKSQEKALSESLKKVNDFLGEEIKKDNVDWLGNFNFSILSIKEFNLTFSASGKIKIALMRGGEITNIGESLNAQEIEPYPLKVFFNIISGKLIEGDKLLVASFDVYNFLEKKNLIQKLAKAKEIDRRILKRLLAPSVLFDKKEKNLSGILTIFSIDDSASRTEKMIISEEKEKINIFASFSKISAAFATVKRKLAKLTKRKESENKFSFAEKIKSYGNGVSFIFSSIKNRFISSNKQAKSKISIKVKGEKQRGLNLSRSNWIALACFVLLIIFASLFYAFKPSKKANTPPIATITEEPQQTIVNPENLENINPEFIFSYNQEEIGFNPQNIIFSKSGFYLWTPDSKNVYNFSIDEEKGSTMEADSKIISAAPFSNSAIFFSSPSYVYLPKGGKLVKNNISVSENQKISLLSSYSSSLYFWNDEDKDIVKYAQKSKYAWASPKPWSKAEISLSPKSIIAEDSLWILSSDNKIGKYYKGEEKTIINFGLSSPISLIQLKTQYEVPYLYLLDSQNKRIIITDKEGKLIKQFSSDKFSDIKDIEISFDGKIIWALCGNSVFEIPFNY